MESEVLLHLSAAARTAAAQAVLDRLNAGTLVLMASERPDGPDSPPAPNGTDARLVALHFAAEAFRCDDGGVAAANPITPGTALGSGQAKWFRCFESDDATAVVDGSVGTSDGADCDADLVLNNTLIERGATVSIASFVYVQAG